MYGNYVREATNEEVTTYKKIETIFNEDFDNERFERIIEAVGDYLLTWGIERRRNYSRVYGYAKRLGVTVEELVTWYCID